METIWTGLRVLLVATIVVAVAEFSKRYPRFGGLLLSLPLVSILAIMLSWFRHGDLPAISRLSRETLILVPLGLPFFVPLAFASRLGLSFWPALGIGILLATATIFAWMHISPNPS